jgi:hypothetical protein
MTIERGPSDPWDPDREPPGGPGAPDEPGDGPPPEPAAPGEEPMLAPGAGQEDPDSSGRPPMRASAGENLLDGPGIARVPVGNDNIREGASAAPWARRMRATARARAAERNDRDVVSRVSNTSQPPTEEEIRGLINEHLGPFDVGEAISQVTALISWDDADPVHRGPVVDEPEPFGTSARRGADRHDLRHVGLARSPGGRRNRSCGADVRR